MMSYKGQNGIIYSVLLLTEYQPQHKLSYGFCQPHGLGMECCRRRQFALAGHLEGLFLRLCKQNSEEKGLLILPDLEGKLMPIICTVLSSTMHTKVPAKIRQEVSRDH